MAVDVNDWNYYLATGHSSDGKTHTNATDGLPQMQVYPIPTATPGNFGVLSLDDSSVDDMHIKDWITGAAAPDLTTLKSKGLLPLSGHDATQWDWQGTPGFKAAGLNDLVVGQTYLLPLFKPVAPDPGKTYPFTAQEYPKVPSGTSYQATVSWAGVPSSPYGSKSGGNGSIAYYQIVQFVGVTVTELDKSSAAYIRPAYVLDPAAVLNASTITPAVPTSSSQLVTTFTTPKLSQ
jgi:hypothetical protein